MTTFQGAGGSHMPYHMANAQDVYFLSQVIFEKLFRLSCTPDARA